MPQSSVSMPWQSTSVTWECDCLAHRFGNAADSPLRERRYPTDMTDGEWARVGPLLPEPPRLEWRLDFMKGSSHGTTFPLPA